MGIFGRKVDDDFDALINPIGRLLHGKGADLQRAEEITQRYHVEGVPLIVINGKYMTDVGKAAGHENLIAEINDLAAGEHKH